MKISNLLICLVFLALFFNACETSDVKPLAENFEINESSIHPEGVAFSNKQQTIFAGSYVKGKVLSLDLEGNVSDFVLDNDFVTVVGLAVDETRNRLIVCNSDGGLSEGSSNETIGQLAEVRFYNLETGEHIRTVDLQSLYAGGHFINDVIADNNGNVYATDSFSPVIYKIDKDYNASVLVEDSRFQVPQGQFGLNGIVYHPNNYLLTALGSGGNLFKIDMNNGNSVTEVATDKSLNAADGMLLTNDNKLVAVSNNFTGAPYQEAVYELQSTNNWETATISGTFNDFIGSFPTTVADVNGSVFVTYAYFPELVTPGAPAVTSFTIQKVLF